jgi:hypothetical protein
VESGSGESRLCKESVGKRREEKLRSSSDGRLWKRRKRPSKDPGGEWGAWGYPSHLYPPPPPLPFFQPPPYGGYPNPPHPPPIHHGPHQQQDFYQGSRGAFPGGRGRPHQPHHQQQQHQNRGQIREGAEKKNQANDGDHLSRDKAEAGRCEKREELKATEDKFPQVICFKCGKAGHYSGACSKPKVCFICYSRDHVVDGCPEWRKPQVATQFYGSANKGLGFYHIDVAQRGGRFRHWVGFDNFGVFTIEEGELTEEEVVQTLKTQIDIDWHWKLLKMEEFRYLVKFPPHIKVESKILGKTTFFYLKGDEVMASLRVWDGYMEPVGRLTETWVQIRGVPPKWSDWITIKEIASSLGRLSEIDWQTLFSGFFRVVRVKVNCKDPKMIPEKRVVEMDDNLFMLYFTVEGLLEQESSSPKGDEKGDEDDGEGE